MEGIGTELWLISNKFLFKNGIFRTVSKVLDKTKCFIINFNTMEITECDIYTYFINPNQGFNLYVFYLLSIIFFIFFAPHFSFFLVVPQILLIQTGDKLNYLLSHLSLISCSDKGGKKCLRSRRMCWGL